MTTKTGIDGNVVGIGVGEKRTSTGVDGRFLTGTCKVLLGFTPNKSSGVGLKVPN